MQRFLACALLGLIAGCGSVSETPHDSAIVEDTAPTGDFTISATPTTLEAPILGTAMVTVTIVRTGEVGAVSLTSSGSPSITAAPATIAEGATSADVTFTLGSGTAAGPATLTITGSDGTHSHDVTVTITAKPIATVAGTVRGARQNIFVGIVGHQPTASAADGTFSFTDVSPPYDLYTYIPASTTSTESKPAQVYFYRGLTTATPFVDAGTPAGGILTVIGFARSADVSGGLTGAGSSIQKKLIAWSSGGSALNPAASYALTATWRGFTPTGGQSINGTMYGLSWTTRSNGGLDQVYFGSVAATLTNGAATGSLNVPFDPVTSTTLPGTITPPAGFPAPSVLLSTVLASGVPPYDVWSGTTTDATTTLPAIAGAKFHLKVGSSSGGAKTTALVPDLSLVTNTNTTLPTPAVLVTPTANATGVTTTSPFHFTAPATGQVYVVTMDSPAASYKVFTTADTVTIPDVTELPVPAATSFSWLVEGYAPANSVDDAALAAAPEGISDADFDGAAHAYTTSATRSFTSQ